MDFDGWLVIGFTAQAAFFLRFFIQWLVSEREGRSTVPVAFWYLSLMGGIGLLAYSIHQRDPVFILGQTSGVLIYSRNLMLIHRARRSS
jgi:lipid-A-disaccharide synthase-like uncharacterized protein